MTDLLVGPEQVSVLLVRDLLHPLDGSPIGPFLPVDPQLKPFCELRLASLPPLAGTGWRSPPLY
jgi:hypothetical protein